MDRKIKIKIAKDGKVEVDSSVFEDCRDIAEQFKKLLGEMEEFSIKDDTAREEEERLKI